MSYMQNDSTFSTCGGLAHAPFSSSVEEDRATRAYSTVYSGRSPPGLHDHQGIETFAR